MRVEGVCHGYVFSCELVDTGCLVLRWHAMLQICIARVFVVCRKTCVRRPCVWCVFFTDLECVCALCDERYFSLGAIFFMSCLPGLFQMIRLYKSFNLLSAR